MQKHNTKTFRLASHFPLTMYIEDTTKMKDLVVGNIRLRLNAIADFIITQNIYHVVFNDKQFSKVQIRRITKRLKLNKYKFKAHITSRYDKKHVFFANYSTIPNYH